MLVKAEVNTEGNKMNYKRYLIDQDHNFSPITRLYQDGFAILLRLHKQEDV